MTSFENLSNEIYYEIFDHLNICDIYKAFSKLNIHFEQLLTSSSLLLKIKLDYKSQIDMKYYCKYVIIPNKDRIISLHLWDSRLLEAFFIHCIIDSSFNRLESIVLYEISIHKLMTILFYLKSLPRFFVLTINLNDNSSIDLSEIYRMIFCLPFLKYNSLSLYGEGESNVFVPLAINKQFSAIESLVINHSCTLNGLISIIHHTPRLNRLDCYTLVESNNKIETEISIILPNLTYASFETCHVKFADFEMFIKKICSQLKVLRIWEFYNIEHTDPDRWKQLVLQNMPQLCKFDLKCNVNFNDNVANNHFNSFVHKFTSRFWIECGWMIGLEIQPEKIFYSININRKTRFNFDKNMKTITYPKEHICHNLIQDGITSQSSTPIDLSITNSSVVEWSSSFINKFSPILLAIQFTRLYISCRDLSIVTLVKIIELLPNLDSIQMSYLPLQQLRCLSIKDAENLRLVSIKNKIKKVSQSSKVELTDFLITLCRRMEHLEMNVKRQSNLTETCNTETKKLRITNDDNNLLITCFENLSNEIYYEIFDYLDGCDIYEAFSNLNIRFQQLINCSSFLLKISVDEKSALDIKNKYEHIIVPNKHQIISLHLWSSILLEAFFTHCTIDSSFDRLESIVFYGLSSSSLISTISYLNSLPHLFALTINLNDDSCISLSEIYQMIFRLPFLKYNSLSLCAEENLNALVPLVIMEKSNIIESLAINHSCTLNGLISILHHTPRLRYLTCQSLIESDDTIQRDVPIPVPNLTQLIIDNCHVEFDEFENFMKKICFQLKILCISEYYNEDYIDPDQWKELISEHMPQLLKFTVKCLINIDDTFKNLYLDAFAHQFTSRFWFEREWNIRLEIESEEIFYLVYPNRKTLFRFDKNPEMVQYTNQNIYQNLVQPVIRSTAQEANNTSAQFSPSKELSITNFDMTEWRSSFIDKFSPILLAIQFSSLYISCREITFYTLIKLINLLPNLDSFKVLSLPLQQLNCLSNEDEENLRLTSKSNKITKVYQSMDLELTQFLITLCPQMEHLEVTWIIDADLKTLVRFILMKTITHSLHLHSLRFNVRNGRDEIVNGLQKMIDSEKLLCNYTIKRSGDEIALQWKL